MANDKWKEMAERTTILRCLVGSQVYGLSLSEKSDRDEKGICIEDYEAAFSLTGTFEQYEYRSAAERTGNKDARSEAGDLDLTIYSLAKAVRLMMNGNPNMIELLFIRGDYTIAWERLGTDLQDLFPLIVSRKAAGAYLGYMRGQMNRYFKHDGDGARKELVEKWGYDIKAASHVMRLGYQGIELLETGKLVLPLSGKIREILLDVKQGKHTLNEVTGSVEYLEDRLKTLWDTSEVRESPDMDAINKWVQSTYWNQWALTKTRLYSIPESLYVH